jgi:hypothetical protein
VLSRNKNSVQEQSKNALDEVKALMSQNSRQQTCTEEEAIAKAKKVLSDVLHNKQQQTSYEDAAKQWIVEEAIPPKFIPHILEDRIDNLIMEHDEKTIDEFGIFLRYLIKGCLSSKNRSEMEEKFFDGFKKTVNKWFEEESWTNLPPGQLWSRFSLLVSNLFSKEHCSDMICLGAKDFKKIIEYFDYEDKEFGIAFNFKGIVSANLIKKLNQEKKVLANEYQIREFWKQTELKWTELHNKDSYDDMMKALGAEGSANNLRYLYIADLIQFDKAFTGDVDFKQLHDIIANVHDADSFACEFKNFVSHEKIHKEIKDQAINSNATPQPSGKAPILKTWNKECLSSLVHHLAMQLAETYYKNLTKMKTAENTDLSAKICEGSITYICDFGDEDEEETDCCECDLEKVQEELEVELLYAAENAYAKWKELPNFKQETITDFMHVLWNGYALSKPVVLKFFDNDDSSFSSGRGLDDKTRLDMKVILSAFKNFVQSSEDDDESSS